METEFRPRDDSDLNTLSKCISSKHPASSGVRSGCENIHATNTHMRPVKPMLDIYHSGKSALRCNRWNIDFDKSFRIQAKLFESGAREIGVCCSRIPSFLAKVPRWSAYHNNIVVGPTIENR